MKFGAWGGGALISMAFLIDGGLYRWEPRLLAS